MTRVLAAEWVPQGDLTLELNALSVTTSFRSASVVAGPGAGKTELLAQRACFLLQTEVCPNPKRVLAISFKKDAAHTLQERVQLRAGDLSRRFESYTFDAFAKGLLDRFLVCVPGSLRPPANYAIINWSKGDIENFLRELRPPRHLGTTYDLVAIKSNAFMRDFVLGSRLREFLTPPVTAGDWAAREFWLQSLQRGRLTFPMIGRLAEAILHYTPTVLQALRQTYAYILLDEFQDTTHVQYDLLHTAFYGATAILTAVGDHKQRIMGWAMALDDAFACFEQDFDAKRYPLFLNYRSAPELVRIQEFLMRALDPDGVPPKAADHLKDAPGSAHILLFPEHYTEARYIASTIHGLVNNDKLQPRDVCVLTKQKPDIYAACLLDELRAVGIKGRIENEFQDLLAEPLTNLVLASLRLATQPRAPREWELLMEHACAAQGVDPNTPASRKVQKGLIEQLGNLREHMATYPVSEQEVHAAIDRALGHDGKTVLKQMHLPYRHGNHFNDTLVSLRKHLWESIQRETSWAAALDDFSGINAVPVMTIHKSKGLEYHTIIFLGLEDSAFWSFADQSTEDTCAFFVAFSRAKRQVLFTFSDQRTTSPNHRDRPQVANSITPLYDILRDAGVESTRIDG